MERVLQSVDVNAIECWTKYASSYLRAFTRSQRTYGYIDPIGKYPIVDERVTRRRTISPAPYRAHSVPCSGVSAYARASRLSHDHGLLEARHLTISNWARRVSLSYR